MRGWRLENLGKRTKEPHTDDNVAVQIAGDGILKIAERERVVLAFRAEEFEQRLENDGPRLGRGPNLSSRPPMMRHGSEGLRQRTVPVGGYNLGPIEPQM